MFHHLQTLVVVASAATVLILRLAILVEWNLPDAVRAINSHEALTLGFQQVLLRIVEPAVDEVSMEAISIAELCLRSVYSSYFNYACLPLHRPTSSAEHLSNLEESLYVYHTSPRSAATANVSWEKGIYHHGPPRTYTRLSCLGSRSLGSGGLLACARCTSLAAWQHADDSGDPQALHRTTR